MGIKRIWAAAWITALAGAFLLNSAPTASADYVRDQQWALNVFSVRDIWAESQGEGVTVAVVDSGVDANHPDLTGQVLKGKDFTGGGNAHEDIVGHGTGMASLIAGHGHGVGNESGVKGLAPKAKILPLRTLQTRADRNLDETWGAAVRYAVDHGAKVVNLSFGNDGGKTLLDGRQAIAYAQAHDVVVVAAAGNDGSIAVTEPAALPGVVAVGAVDKNANRWDGSNSGKGLTLMAPGADIVSANSNRSPKYGMSDGTSDATAYVSAAAALVRAKYPNLSAGQVINRLIKSASFLHHKGLKAPDEEYGYGIVRPYKALTMSIPKGTRGNPLGHIQLAREVSGGNDTAANQPENQNGSSSMGAIVLLVGIIGFVVVIAAVTVVVVTRSRRNSMNGGPPGGTYPQSLGYPPQQVIPPAGQHQYPAPPPNQGYGYPTPPAQPPQHANPYSQQPPYQGQ
ncbi:type VII secretion-associated serine protease mycosin [Streptomyces sp. NPDC049541]|uniref:type VII secretion-associated serine protease mycosin n=1 Tax=Streptomyces sp. NPDC049541 TaxID=3365594 RepID=UPI0037B7FC25